MKKGENITLKVVLSIIFILALFCNFQIVEATDTDEEIEKIAVNEDATNGNIKYPQDVTEEMAEAENPTLVKDRSRTPDEKAEIYELKNRICESMKKLSQREQDLIEAKYFYDKKLKDISAEFNISQSRISRIIQSGLNKIRKELEKNHLL